MARGTQFGELLARLRSETGRSDNLSVGTDDLPTLKQAINSNYQTLYQNHDWPHLKTVFPRLSLVAGQRYYDFPTGLNSDRVIAVTLWRNRVPTSLERGIGFDDYLYYDSEDGDRSEPAQKWDVKWSPTGSRTQIEIWPVPSTNTQTVQFIGIYNAPRLVANTDVCLLDDDLVVGFAAAEVLGEKSANGKVKLSKAQDHLRVLKARGKGGEQRHQMGLGNSVENARPLYVIRVGG